MPELGRWDYRQPNKAALEKWDTFSVGIFQWVPARTGTLGIKRSRAVLRVKGYTTKVVQVLEVVDAVVKRLNELGLSIDQIVKSTKREGDLKAPVWYWAHTPTGLQPPEVAEFLINELFDRWEKSSTERNGS